MAASPLTAKQIVGALGCKYPKPEWASFCELCEYTSSGRDSRRIDFWAISCYVSTQWASVACEVKVSRSDWIKEAADPSKRAFFEAASSEFWYVSPAGIIRPEEVPAECGLYHVTDSLVFRTVKVAPHKRVEQLPVPFIAALARRFTDGVPTTPRAFWRFEGQEIDQDALRAMLKQEYARDLEDEKRRLRANQTPDSGEWSEFGKAVAHKMGKWSSEPPTAEDFGEWMTDNAIPAGDLRYWIRMLRETLNQLYPEGAKVTEE